MQLSFTPRKAVWNPAEWNHSLWDPSFMDGHLSYHDGALINNAICCNCLNLPSRVFKYRVVITGFTPKTLLSFQYALPHPRSWLRTPVKVAMRHVSSVSPSEVLCIHFPSGKGILSRLWFQAGLKHPWKEPLLGLRWTGTLCSVGPWLFFCSTVSRQWRVARKITV